MSKIKVRIDNRSEPEAFSVPTQKDVVDFMGDAGWTDHPGDGKAILLEDGREVVNPLPHDPPLGFTEQPSIVDQVMAKLNARRIMQLQDEEEIDIEAEVNDFDVPDDVDFTSVYEVTMQDEYPGVREEMPVVERAGDPPVVPPKPPAPPIAPAEDPPKP